MILWFAILVSLNIISTREDEVLKYEANDTVFVEYGQSLEVTNSLSTMANQFVSAGQLKVFLTFSQVVLKNQSLLYYNILYFNLDSTSGQNCYTDYFNSNLTTNEMPVRKCPQINAIYSNADKNINCINLTGCTSQSFKYYLELEESQYNQSIFMIQNDDLSNLKKKEPLILRTNLSIYLNASNLWFYIAIALTFFFVINLVFMTGVVLYWALRQRKIQREYEEHLLTEVEYNEPVMEDNKQD